MMNTHKSIYRITSGVKLYERETEEDCPGIEHPFKNVQALFCMTFFIASLKWKNGAYTLSLGLMDLKAQITEQYSIILSKEVGP